MCASMLIAFTCRTALFGRPQASRRALISLAMIEADLGAEIAADVAREMVVYAKRPGGQAQHSALLDLDAPRFSELNTWMRDHLASDLSVEALATRAAMSPRNLRAPTLRKPA
jgi:transcriptional regulator GlxA family with amidase domain